MDEITPTFLSLFQDSIRRNWEFRALTDYGGNSFTYKDAAARILRIHAFFRATGVNRGDHVALLGKNSASWGILYIATVSYGAVIVPILPDFKPADVQTIVHHSDSVILFSEESLWKPLDAATMPQVRLTVRIQDYSILYASTPEHRHAAEEAFRKTDQTQNNISPEQVVFPVCGPDDPCVISYTSGTTGFSKGVVLPHRSLLGNMLYARRNMPLESQDRILSFLPLAHTYGCAFEFLFPFTLGCDITFLTKSPSPKIIMQAFQEIRPSLILSVPLVIEKIYKAQIIPAMRPVHMKVLTRIPGLSQVIYKKVRQKLFGVFGGNFRELVIGGAPFNAEAERFFRKIRFPFTVGYGMTECGPLISYASWDTTVLGASGRIVDELEVKIDSHDPLNTAGEILVRGAHVMLGYYKNAEATRQVLEPDGWLHTGDLGLLDKHGNIHIRGRSKSMILGPSGKNIYPEELESILNNRFMVAESLVIERDDKLVALICPDYDAVQKAGHIREELQEIYQGYLRDLNHQVPKYMSVSSFEIVESEFEKTPKRSIKRFLYT